MFFRKFFSLFVKGTNPFHTLVKPMSVFFVHIPKTAGTSFRAGIESVMSIEKDYGDKSKETTKLVSDAIYRARDPYQLLSAYKKNPFSLAGHVSITKYADIYEMRNIVCYLRQPIEQVVSHYYHSIHFLNFQGTFTDFYTMQKNINLQSKYLGAMPISLIGYVGITERYNESLQLINHGLSLNIKPLVKNEGIKSANDNNSVDPTVLSDVARLNAKDIAQYQLALALHSQRIALFNQQLSWTYMHAKVNDNNVLHGCAFFADSDNAVELMVRCNNKVLSTIKASDFYGLFPKFCFPRGRYIGFTLPLGKIDDLDIQVNEIELVVTNTGQVYKVDLKMNGK